MSALQAFDSHTHLNHPRLRPRVAEVVERARCAGVGEMVVVGYDLESSREAMQLAHAFDGLWAAVGVHPHEASRVDARVMEALAELAKDERVVAVGETGLDFYRDLSPRARQREAFLAHLRLAKELRKPLIVHCRAAGDDLLEVAAREGAGGWIWHCFDGSPAQARRAVELGMWVGLAGTVTRESRRRLEEVMSAVPGDRLLLETDCPYLPPPGTGRDNEPANLPRIAEALAALWETESSAVLARTAANARAAFHVLA